MTIATEKFENAKKIYLAEQAAIGLSDETICNYSGRLRRFKEFWEQSEPEADPTPEDIRNYRNMLLDKGLAKSSVRQYLTELKGFFEFCCDDEFCLYAENPVSKRMFPKITDADDKIYTKILSAEDLKLLWRNEPPSDNQREHWKRNYAIVVLLLDGKIRNIELLNLRLSDIDFEYHEIEIRCGKGKKRRWITVSDISTSAIKLYLQSGIRPDYCSDEDFLFGNTFSKTKGVFTEGTEQWHQGSRAWLSELVERHIKAVTGKSGFRTHSLRHNGAILDLHTGVRKERLQAELGHSSIATTEIYSGRLQSVRKTRDYYDVAAYRDQCAAENMRMLEAIA